MSESALGATAIINPPPPETPEAAAAAMAELDANPDFQKRVAALDPTAFSERLRLWRFSRGLPAEPAPPQGPVDVDVERDARAIAALQQHADVLERQGYTEEQQIQILGRRPITMQDRKMHERLYEEKRNNAAFMARWSAGDPQAIKEMRDHAIAKSLPVGTLTDIEMWENG